MSKDTRIINKEIDFSFGVEFPEDDVLFMPEEEIDRYLDRKLRTQKRRM